MSVPALGRENQACLVLILAPWFIIYNTAVIEKRKLTSGSGEAFNSGMLLELQLPVGPIDRNSFSSSTEEESGILSFFPLDDLRSFGWFCFSSTEELHPPHTLCMFEPSCKNCCRVLFWPSPGAIPAKGKICRETAALFFYQPQL